MELNEVCVCRLGEMEEQLDNRDKEYRDMKMKAEERIKALEKKLVLLLNLFLRIKSLKINDRVNRSKLSRFHGCFICGH